MAATDRRRDAPQVHAETAEEWRAWLVEHHADAVPGVWLVSWKSATGRPAIEYEAAVEEALAFGWIDSTAATLDDERSMLWFTRRRRGSGWSRRSKERVARIEADGRMTDAGRAVVAAARADGSWTLLDDIEDLVVPADLAAAFDAHPGARDQWESFPRSVRRGILDWIRQARRPGTREARIDETARLAARGERAHEPRRR